MAKKGIFPAQDLDFNDYILRVIPHLAANKMKFKLEDEDITSANNLLTEWKAVFPKSQRGAERTTAITIEKNNLRADISKLIRQLVADIPKSQLTIQDRSTMELKERDSVRTAPGLPASPPDVNIRERGHTTFKLHFRHPDNPDSQKKPKGVKFLECQIWVNGVFIDNRFTGKFLLFIIMDVAHEGKKVSFRARYINNRGETGRWSESVESFVA